MPSAAHELSLSRTIANATAIALRNARILQSLRDQTQQITFARFEAERRLKTLQRYADFFESAADGIVVIDSDGQAPLLQPARPRDHRTRRGRARRPASSATCSPTTSASARAPSRRGFRQGIYPQGVDIRIRRNDGAVGACSA